MREEIAWGAIAVFALRELYSIFSKAVSKSGDSVHDHETRIAVAYEKIDQMNNRLAVIERDQKTQWREHDKLLTIIRELKK